MSVYTELNLQDMLDFTKQFDFGNLKSFQGVEAGVENTTYLVSFDQAETVLQIFEEQGFDEIPFLLSSIVVSRKIMSQSQHRLPIGLATDSLRSKENRLLYSSVFKDQQFPDLRRGMRTNR